VDTSRNVWISLQQLFKRPSTGRRESSVKVTAVNNQARQLRGAVDRLRSSRYRYWRNSCVLAIVASDTDGLGKDYDCMECEVT
jgi:hypothetical protein